MTEHPDLIALALIEQEGKRSLPLGGKSLTTAIDTNSNPGEIGENLAQQVLLRVLQKTDEKPLRRAFGEKSLLLIQVSMVSMQEQIPLIKANWISSGDNTKLIYDLRNLCDGVWSMTFSREKGIHFCNLT